MIHNITEYKNNSIEELIDYLNEEIGNIECDYKNVDLLLNCIKEKGKEIERLNNITKNINKILKDDDLCHVEKLQEIHKLVGSDKE